MRVLVVGHIGQLGTDLMGVLAGGHEGVGVDRDEIDITSAPSVDAVMAQVPPRLTFPPTVMAWIGENYIGDYDRDDLL